MIDTRCAIQVGNLIHNLGTFVAGMAVAFSKGWSMTLVMLSVVPIMAVLGLLFATVYPPSSLLRLLYFCHTSFNVLTLCLCTFTFNATFCLYIGVPRHLLRKIPGLLQMMGKLTEKMVAAYSGGT